MLDPATSGAFVFRDPPPIWAKLCWYAFTFGAALAFPFVGYRLDSASIYAPLVHESNGVMFNDTLLIQPMVQAYVEGHTHWSTPRLGAPGHQMMHDFPVVDHFHFLWLWLIGLITGSTILTFNLYYLLGYPLAAISMLAVLRAMCVRYPAAVACGLLFACLPYHQYRGENHYFLSAYYMVPPACLIMLWITAGRLPFFTPLPSREGLGEGPAPATTPSSIDSLASSEPSPGSSLKGRGVSSIFTVLIMLIVGSAGAYYAFFACALLGFAGVYAWLVGHGFRAMLSSWLCIGVCVVSGVANHAPTFLYHAQHGKYTAPVDRPPEDAEYYGLKLTQLVMPIDDHKLQSFAAFKSIYNSYLRPAQAYTERYSLGLVLAAVFVVMLACLILPVRKREPYGALIALTGFAVVLGVVGGFGAVFNQTITPSVRCYNRIAIYIACFVLMALAVAGNRVGGSWKRQGLFWGVLLWVALWDLTPNDWGTDKRVHDINANQAKYFEDARFFARIEETMPAGSMIFQLPYVSWPESPPTHQLGSYDHARGYLHTKTLRWSFGCIKGRETDEWYRSVSLLAPNAVAPMLDRLARAGFEGLYLDKSGYSPAQAKLLEKNLLQTIAGANPIRHDDGKQLFFDLRRHREDIRGNRDWAVEAVNETQRPCILWLEGFVAHREPGYEWQKRWGGPKGVALFVNPTNETKTYKVTFRLYTELKEPSELTIDGGDLWSETLTIDRNSPSITREFTIPPGRHKVTFRCVPPANHIPTEHRRLTFLISGLKLE